jgi:DNA sulfur modification protein DndD
LGALFGTCRKSKVDAAFLNNVMAANYRAVYEALQAIENTGASEYWPACSTPLARVVDNPFDKARRELATLGVLHQFKISQQRVEGGMTHFALAIGTTITAVDSNAAWPRHVP